MAKTRTAFFCRNCGAQSPKWIGKCPSCGEWNTYIEEVIQRSEPGTSMAVASRQTAVPTLITDIAFSSESRIDTHNGELNRVLGGGLVPGSVILVGGEPGIGKSTLMLQVALTMPAIRVLYVSGEESEQQIRMRAERLGMGKNECYILTETSTTAILNHIAGLNPGAVIIDSIQTLTSESIDASAGSISQIRETASELQRYAKTANIPVFLIGHITKEGSLAGPKLLEHMVDTVLQFEGDRNYGYRILRSVKNRFGSTSELGIYEMQGDGLREVSNPSEILITQHEEPVSGTTVAATIEGLRPMLIETQALVSTAAYGTPQRSCTGFDTRRLNMLLAVLEKRSGFKLGVKDVFLNIAGGLRVDDPATDLAVVSAVLSSSIDIPVSSKTCFAAEVGLSGEIRPVTRVEQRVSEAEKLGFGTIVISKLNLKAARSSAGRIKIQPVGKVEEVFRLLFG
ncbi:DNA repair protein RadA [Lentimicrobium sp.]|uniref:DNA repair protein RadA n=1 Tax=Lentimicrobium sp. TaxID=2034841 RepID=UPI002C256E8D|nr:DNA repair protein RadA [Lentimicrobium sp.]HPR26471.1 DNA repair protein RadA [Lentimicrobium sp.]